MRLLMLCPYFFPEKNAAAARAMAFAKYFALEGVEVHVMVPETNRIPATTSFRGIPVSRVETYDSLREKRGVVRSTLGFRRTVRELRREIQAIRPDIVMTTTPSPFFAFEGQLACRPLGIPIVFDVRDTWLLLSLNHPGGFSNFLKRRIEGQCCWGARKVLVVTAMLGDQLVEDHHLPADRIVLASNGADLEMFNVRSSPEVDLILLGAPSTYRNLEEVFQALSVLVERRPSTSIRYVGWFDSEYTRHLKRVADGLGLAGKIEYGPPVPHAEVPSALARARVGLVSLTGDAVIKPAVGAKSYEYLAAGLPLACFGPPSDCELRRLWQTTEAGIYESEPGRFAERVREMLDDENLRKSMAEKAKQAARVYDRKTIAHKVYVEVLQPIVDGVS